MGVTASACKGIIGNMSLAELPRPKREPGFYLEHRVRDAWTQALFIELVREGMDKAQAAVEAGTTATKMRALRKRDTEFRNLYDEAVEAYQEAFQDRIRRQWHERAFDKDDAQATRLFDKLAEAHLPELAYKRSKHITHDNPLQVQAIPMIDPVKFDQQPLEWREDLLAKLEEVVNQGKQEEKRLRDVSAG